MRVGRRAAQKTRVVNSAEVERRRAHRHRQSFIHQQGNRSPVEVPADAADAAHVFVVSQAGIGPKPSRHAFDQAQGRQVLWVVVADIASDRDQIRCGLSRTREQGFEVGELDVRPDVDVAEMENLQAL